LAVIISGAHEHNVNFLLPLVFREFPRIKGARGRPATKPRVVRADCGYTSRDVSWLLSMCGIRPEIAQRGVRGSDGLGKHRWPIERTFAWLKQMRRVGVRRDRTDSTYNAFVQLACALISYRKLAF